MTILKIAPIGQLCTLDDKWESSSAESGMKGLGVIRDGAIVVEGEKIVWTGAYSDLPPEYKDAEHTIDARYRAVVPSLIDCHTHTVFSGTRVDEFDRRLRGESYIEIMNAGGGIRSTVKKTREATAEKLFMNAKKNLDFMKFLGVTTVEIKSGYGLVTEAELKILRVIHRLQEECAIEIVSTFLGAHAFPAEYVNRKEDYVSLIVERMLPLVKEEGLAEFCDIFLEEGAFNYEQAVEIFTAAKNLGFKLRVHANQLSPGDGVKLAAKFGALSADHLEYSTPDDIKTMKKCDIVAVLLPGAALTLREKKKPPVREMIEEGVAVALATDFNPGSSPTAHLPLCMTLACTLYDLYPSEALKAVTLNAAKALDRGERIGKLAPGYDADILILETHDYRDLVYRFPAQIARILIKKGRIIQQN
ncbi:MAG: imidazolonepropionase [Myxococcota bacterium]